MWRLAIVGMLVGSLVAACTSSAEPTVEYLSGDMSTCEGFLEVSEVEEVSGEHGLSVELEARVRPARRVCNIFFEAPGGAGDLYLVISQYDSASGAEQEYQELLERLANWDDSFSSDFEEGVLGRGSVQIKVDIRGDGYLAPTVSVRKGTNILWLQVAADGNDPFMASMDGAVDLARLALGRLP
jgi:hypothetical protein